MIWLRLSVFPMGIPLHLALDVQVDEPIEILRSYSSRTTLMDTTETIGNATVIKKTNWCMWIN